MVVVCRRYMSDVNICEQCEKCPEYHEGNSAGTMCEACTFQCNGTPTGALFGVLFSIISLTLLIGFLM